MNPGTGTPWLGDPETLSEAIYTGLHAAVSKAETVSVPEIRVLNQEAAIPLDMERHAAWLAFYREDPSRCDGGAWVDPPFAADWHREMSEWDASRIAYSTPISGFRLGEVAVVFHPAELYSYYGLKIRHNDLFRHTVVVGYADDFIGYLTDSNAYVAGEYAAITVPKIVGLPPFTPDAARHLAAGMETLLSRLADEANAG